MCDAIEFGNHPSTQTAPYQSIIIVTLTVVRASFHVHSYNNILRKQLRGKQLFSLPWRNSL